MLELATFGFYGLDGEWLNYLATISKFQTTTSLRSLCSVYDKPR